MSKTVLVIGARGFIGKRTYAMLRATGDFVVAAGGRRGPRVVDLNAPRTFAAMDSFDVVVNCSDTVAAPPRRAAEYCLACGITFIETGAHAPALRELLALAEHYPDGPGTLIVGAGLFPGVSNLLAHQLGRRSGDCRSLELGMAVRALCGSGAGIVALMVGGYDAPAHHYRAGHQQQAPQLSDGPALSFPSRSRKTLYYDFVEAALLHHSTDVATIASYYAPLPGWLRPLIRLSARMRPSRRGLLQRGFDALTRASLRLARGLLFRWRSSRTELVVVANRGEPDQHRAWITTADAMGATAAAIAATTQLVAAAPNPRVATIGQAVELEPVLDRMRRLGVDLELGLEGEVDTELVELAKLAHQ